MFSQEGKMLAVQVLEYYKKELNSLKKLENTINYMKKNNLFEQKVNIITKVLNSNVAYLGSDVHFCLPRNNGNDKIKELYNSGYKQFIHNFCFNEFAKQIREIELDFEKNTKEYNFCDQSIKGFIDNLNEILLIHENLVRNMYQNNEKVLFFDKQEKLIINYDITINSIINFINSLTNANNDLVVLGKNELSLQLLDVEYELNEFASILDNLNNAYNTALKIDNQYDFKKLQIVKIESGSFFAKILGDPIIVSVLIYLLEKVIDIIYKKYSLEGKIDLSAKELHNITSSIQSLEILKENGIDISENNKEITQCLNIVINNLHKIIVKSPKIKINGKKYSIDEAEKYLEYTKKYLEMGKSKTIEVDSVEASDEFSS